MGIGKITADAMLKMLHAACALQLIAASLCHLCATKTWKCAYSVKVQPQFLVWIESQVLRLNDMAGN
jgi:hypothetical protein